MRVPLEWLKEFVTIRDTPEALAGRLTMAGLEVVGIERVNGEPVLDLEITPNRADCLSILGVAREVAVLTGQRLKLPGQETGDRRQGKRGRTRLMSHVSCLKIVIEDRAGCRRYIGRLLEGVRMGSSPAWMQRRLAACGLRPINTVVDITNYVLLETGQPLHAFDFDRLAQGTIVVRRAQATEALTTLDGVRRTLSPEILVIADAETPVAVAGVMGGVGSEVTPTTRRVLLESAWFDPVTVRRAARRLGLASESSYRFERGVDPVGVETASARAGALIRELAGGEEAAVRDVGAKPSPRRAITVEGPRLNRWLGTRLEAPTIRSTLAQLSCRVASSGMSASMQVTPPSFRQDLTQAVDLYEEVARVMGYHRIPATIPGGSIAPGRAEEGAAHRETQSLRRFCASLGLTEVITWSLVSEAELARCGYSASQAVRLSNPLSQDHASLRPLLALGLLQAVRRNLTHGATGVRIFELGSVVQPQPCEERLHLGLALSGWWLRDWRQARRYDFWVLKGLLQALLARRGDGEPQFRSGARPWAEAGQCAEVSVGGRLLGVAGQLSAAIARDLNLGQAAWVAELDASALLRRQQAASTVQAPPALPSVKRDLSVQVGQEVPFETVDRVIRSTAGLMAHRVELIDRFDPSTRAPASLDVARDRLAVGPSLGMSPPTHRGVVPSEVEGRRSGAPGLPGGLHKGEPLDPGTYSLTFSIEYRDPARTLTADEVDALHQRIGRTLTDQLQAKIR